MYRGFNLKLAFEDDQLYKIGLASFEKTKGEIKKTLSSFNDNSLNGSQIQENWFPQIDADIFISHSHKDERKAITLAGWLSEKFNIKSFIDSCIWGYSDELLKNIDNKYCLNPSGETYSYEKRNYSTSHVHMMLSTALTMMIDKTECLFFLNTPNSISTSNIVNHTESPWIYGEIAITQMIRQKTPRRRFKQDTRYFSKGGAVNENLKIKYELNLNHLVNLSQSDLEDWMNKNKVKDSSIALDCLYDLNPIPNLNYIEG